YRRLVYGAEPDSLLPGERVNLFFAPDERHERGYLVHFQDEIGQMKGHGHYWQVVSAGAVEITARAMAGDKPLEDRVQTFLIDPACERWKGGKAGANQPTKGDKLYLTWVSAKGQRTVKLLADEA